MHKQNNIQPNKSVQKLKNIWIFFVSVVATAIIVGGLVYWWQNQQLQKYKTRTENIKVELQSNETNDVLLSEKKQLKSQDSESDNKENITQTTGGVSEGRYTNNTYNFSFTIPSGWVFQREEKNFGDDLLRVYLTFPEFNEKTYSKSEDILSISVTKRTFDEEYQYMDWNVTKESEEKITVAGREAVKRIGLHEFGGYLTVVILPNGNNTIELILRTNKEPYASQFQTLLDSFKFTE